MFEHFPSRFDWPSKLQKSPTMVTPLKRRNTPVNPASGKIKRFRRHLIVAMR
jgi:hypothetical protein